LAISKKIRNFRYFPSKAEKRRRLWLYICVESFALFCGDFCMDLYSVASDEAMKRCSEAMKH
jgi:hypothetical protein